VYSDVVCQCEIRCVGLPDPNKARSTLTDLNRTWFLRAQKSESDCICGAAPALLVWIEIESFAAIDRQAFENGP
jgi:hypothetical protein